uniref:Orphan G-protein coupled receptor 64 n=1 Tax=Platynereis dumerilii TaxID=6359 RepID=A0A0K0PUX3_PLADU|nr:orphan G-protein coupled receptor 64 [Platynereis dumerilii]
MEPEGFTKTSDVPWTNTDILDEQDNGNFTDHPGISIHGGAAFITEHPMEAGFYLIITGIASILGTFGNILVMASFAVNPALQNSKNVFIFNVALADILVTSIADPFGILGMVYGSEYFDSRPAVCDFIATLCIAACVTALFSIGGISFNRFISICHPSVYSKVFGLKANLAMCFAFWVGGIGMSLPALVGWTDNIYDHKMLECIWNRLHSLSYTIFFSTCVVFTPVVIISFSYLKIFLHVRASRRKVATMAGANAATKKQEQSSLKLARSFFIIFMIFVGCWSPYAILVLVDWNDSLPLNVHLFILMVAHLHASLNPLVHAITNTHFRKGYAICISKMFCIPLSCLEGPSGMNTNKTASELQASHVPRTTAS